jgi:hypothetical protein
MNFYLVNNLNLMQEIFYLPELVPQVSVTVIKTINIHVSFLPEIVTTNYYLWLVTSHIEHTLKTHHL